MSYKSFFNWSGGKDSALALYYALQDSNYRVERLVTNISNPTRRVSMHGVREELVELQAAAIGIPLQKTVLSDEPTMSEYERVTIHMLRQLQEDQFTHSFYGDIFLEDLKIYREKQLASLPLTPVFPLWKRDTKELLSEFIDLGFKTIVVCANSRLLDESFVGRVIDTDFLKDLPPGVDPCGENGEFHTFVFDGPIFTKPVMFDIGEKVLREYKEPQSKGQSMDDNKTIPPSLGFWFIDLLPQ